MAVAEKSDLRISCGAWWEVKAESSKTVKSMLSDGTRSPIYSRTWEGKCQPASRRVLFLYHPGSWPPKQGDRLQVRFFNALQELWEYYRLLQSKIPRRESARLIGLVSQ
jgi:hypothetical protein